MELLGLVLDRFQDGADFIQAFRHNGVEHRHGPCTGLGGTYGAEFEFIACEGKGAGAVPVGGVQREHGQGVHADVDGLLGARFFSASFLDLLNDFIQQISQEEAKEMMDTQEVIILDVREQDEYDSGHIPGAVLLPVGTIDDTTAAQVIPEKDSTVLVYCRSGNRSKTASAALADLGYTNIYEFGGINTWPYETES